MNWQEILSRVAFGNPVPARKIEKSMAEWAAMLSPEAFRVTREQGTETPFSGAYCAAFQPGLYACVGCGTPLFDSRRKYDSETGWPSFDEPVDSAAVAYFADAAGEMERVEVRCNTCDGHLGHVFPDGPREGSGLRFCINSASMLLLPERPYEPFFLRYERMVQGERKQAPYTLLFVFRMDCPGCFLYGLNEAAGVAASFDPAEVEVLGLCTEFGTFDPDIVQKLNDFIVSGQVSEAMQQALSDLGGDKKVLAPDFAIALDQISSPEDFLDADTLQWFYSLNPNYPLLSMEEMKNIVQNANFYYRQQPMVAHTFSLNFMRGTPLFVLLNERGEKLADWLGHVGAGALVHQIRMLTAPVY